MGRWRILSHPTGSWVVQRGPARWVVPEIPARWLLPLEGRRADTAEVLECLHRGNQADGLGWSEARLIQVAEGLTPESARGAFLSRRRALWLRIPLLSARWTRALAHPLEGLTGARMLMALMAAGVAGLGLVRLGAKSGVSTFHHWLLGMGLFGLGAVLHELGHAAALAAQGYPAGGMGAGILFVIPVLHNDVSAMALLPTGGKLRVDLAGIAFQSAYGALLLAMAAGPGRGFLPWTLAAGMTYMAVAWSLMPFIRADGYWALSDLLGLPDLDRPLTKPKGRGAMIFILAHRLLNVVFLSLVATVLPVVWAGRVSRWIPGRWHSVASVVLPGLLVGLWWVMGRRVWGLLQAMVADMRLWHRVESGSPTV